MRTLLLTPGPLTTTDEVRAAMNRDWGSRDEEFVTMSERVRARLASLYGYERSHVAVPVQGSGTFGVEAALQTTVPRDAHLLVAINGAYGRRIVTIAERYGRRVSKIDVGDEAALDPAAIAHALANDPSITDVAVVYVETTCGVLNPLAEIASVVHRAGKRLFVDAMSGFGSLPLAGLQFTTLVASSNKGLESAPGLAFALIDRAHLERCERNATSLALDLFAQWRGFERDGQWRFTPPVQIVAALDKALDLLEREGGQAARQKRYETNCATLIAGLQQLGYASLLDPAIQAPIIVTVRAPTEAWYEFNLFYDTLGIEGVRIYPGKTTAAASFRVGCIGAVDARDMQRAVDAIGRTTNRLRQSHAATA
ncbi:2-aminoethylphosphonate--pyruvate transaminase [Roseiterribacter gracilis]|uniref:2-aminoethylphosphonate--pyruvate transaminase n=1 Tax=Roseiterribacter gracilis TaxID=2812848 RepID=A0A8S8XHS6_9PROT|nr:2-aminoethylphosphonate--pyruvate transaminase [Rhodospirillales bacterium TMPK1]